MTSVLVNVCCERGNTWSRRRKAVTASSFFGSWFTNDCKDGRTGWFCRAQRQPCCSSRFLLYNISCLQTAASRKWRRFGQEDKQAFLHGSRTLTHSHTHPRQKQQTGLGLSPSAAASLPSPAPPPPHRPSAGERQRRNERLGVVYLRADEQAMTANAGSRGLLCSRLP